MKLVRPLTSARLSFATLALLIAGRGSAQQFPPDSILMRQYLGEARTLCRRDNGALWGISLCGPILLVDPATRKVWACQGDAEGVLSKAGDVFVGLLPTRINVANTAVDWAGQKWTMIMLPLPADRARRTGLMAHELWHRVQDRIGFPSSGAANNHLDSREGRVWLQLEWRALAAALTATGSQRRLAVSDALVFRARRRQLFAGAASEERQMEMHEGLAEYTGVKLNGQSAKARHVASSLGDAARKQSFVRSFAYSSGPAYGILLDETHAHWRPSLKKEMDLGALLQTRLGIRLPRDIERSAAERAAKYDGPSLIAAETQRENQRRELLARYRSMLVAGPVLVIPLEKMNMQFNPGNLVPLDSLGTVYPNIRIVDVWGILTVEEGALMNSTYSRIDVAVPATVTGSVVTGKGWTLELTDGWAVMPGTRSGDLVVKRAQK